MHASDSETRSALMAPYRPSWSCRDSEPLQRALNELYDYADDPETKVLHRCRINLITRIMTRLARRGRFRSRRRALDLGCNAGYYGKLISDLGFEEVLGIDIDAGAIERARRHLSSDAPGRIRRFEVADATRLDAPGAYDFILCTEVIEHTGKPDQVIPRLCSALSPDGIALVTLPNAVSVAYGWARLIHALKRQPPDDMLREHLSFPFPRALRVFEPHGLRTLEVHGTNLLLAQPLISAWYGQPWFGALHRASAASARGPLKYFAQFLCLVLDRNTGPVR